ncbi:hypothetical protein NADFUDRAFT_70893 [Nadsonia fulvescens var. elongata DSM 6958]|uniref:Uncharacterized protein n=1 Tax=Nadsonia fulvescens var. elongata DSM 6958 TaxID=857566 RepID=A0A1E3PKF9_9ASCO|nr:hypothetical protein NADFUDRAFT_70893 [Nadsonia fulvescens var. elongata DSM 6958]
MEKIMEEIERKRNATFKNTHTEHTCEASHNTASNPSTASLSGKFKGEGHVLGRSISGPVPFMRYGNLATLNTPNGVGYSFGSSNLATLPTESNLKNTNFEDNTSFLGIDTEDEMVVDKNNKNNNDDDDDDDDDVEYNDADGSMVDIDDAEKENDNELVDDNFVDDL